MAAKDGADAVGWEYEQLPANCDPLRALSNKDAVLVDADVGDAGAVDRALARAAHVVRLQTQVNRITGVPLELRCALGAYDGARYTVYAPSGGVQRFRADIAGALGVPESEVRFVSREVGG